MTIQPSHSNLEIFFAGLYANVEKIKDCLLFDNTNETYELCQYTKLDTLRFLVKGYDGNNSNKNPTFRLSNVIDLNDTSEGRVCIDFLNCCSSMPIFSYIFRDTRERYKPHKIVLSDTYVGSFSTAKDHHSMWKDYGDKSQGCCLVFDKTFFQNLRLYKVHYIDRRYLDPIGVKNCNNEITDIMNTIAESIVRQYEILKNQPAMLEKVISVINEIRFLFKTDEWDYENEVRLVLRADVNNTSYVDMTNGIPRSFLRVNNPISIKEIMLGAKVDRFENHAQHLLHCGVANVYLSASTFK